MTGCTGHVLYRCTAFLLGRHALLPTASAKMALPLVHGSLYSCCCLAYCLGRKLHHLLHVNVTSDTRPVSAAVTLLETCEVIAAKQQRS
jgi:hypothetical protein